MIASDQPETKRMFMKAALVWMGRTRMLVVLACAGATMTMAVAPASANASTRRPGRLSANERATRVTVPTGTLQGEVVGGGRQWLGIPYSAPPVGNLRWRPPSPPASWHGVREATRFGSPCLQSATDYDVHRGSENCLYLNVYAPGTRAAKQRLPVIVWLHGGGFVNGSGNDFNGRFLAATAHAIVVTINYRLGPFGWLALKSLEQDGSSGDYGLMDQRARRSTAASASSGPSPPPSSPSTTRSSTRTRSCKPPT
jgi:para-nitrobenzyl esterase